MWYVYHWGYPIDFGWEFLQTIDELADRFDREPQVSAFWGRPYPKYTSAQLRVDLAAAIQTAGAARDGLLRKGGEPRVFWLPGPNKFAYGFVWKQDDEGDTYVATPFKMPRFWKREASLINSRKQEK